MSETVSDVIVARARESQGLSWMVGASIAAHALLVGVLLVAPFNPSRDEEPKTVMTISLGGGGGARTGMTPMGGAPVQTRQPVENTARAPVAPAPKAPEMTLPTKTARPRAAQVKPEVAPKEATSRTPISGDEVREGSTRQNTGARGQGFGLSGGGGGAGQGAYVDVGNFCCPEYLETIVQVIQRNWNSRQNAVGSTLMKFTIERNGQLRDMVVERQSGFYPLDMAAQRAMFTTGKVPPLPGAFTNPSLTVYMWFKYERQ